MTPRPLLTRREHRYLWLISQGYTPREAFQVMGVKSSPSVSTRVCEKIGARRIEQAIYLACSLDMLGPYEDCGSAQGYRAHHGRRQEPCRTCRRWFTEYTERQGGRVVPLRQVKLTEPELRLLRAFDSGRTFRQVADNWGCSVRTLDDVRTSLYLKLDVAHLPQNAKRPTLLEEGRRRGLLSTVPVPRVQRNPRRWGTTDLTDLEQRTLAVLADGTSLSEAGKILGIPGSSVSSRLARIYSKLNVLDQAHGERRAAAVKEARNRGYCV